MTGPPHSADFDDPLVNARRAVNVSRFQDAWTELNRLPEPVRTSPEGLLLGAMASWRLGEFVRSRTAALQARDGFRARGDTDGEMRAENVAAAGAFALGNMDEAERGFTRALSLADELGDDLMMARCANNLGNVAYYRSRYESALSFYRLATANFEKLTFWKGFAESWLNSAIVLHDAGSFEASREAGARAVEAAERSRDERVLGQALAARSEAEVALGDLALALAQATRALALAQLHEHVVGEADALRILSVIARLRGQADHGEAFGRRALEIAQRVGDPWRRAEIQRDLGTLYAAVGRARDAAAAFSDAARAFDALGAESRAAAMREQAAAANQS